MESVTFVLIGDKYQYMKRKLVVAVVAPGFRPREDVLNKIQDYITSQNYFDFQYDSKIIESHPLNSASIELRKESLARAILDPQVDVIWCLRGGYGSLQLLPKLVKLKKPKKKKLLIGLSDITSLHIFLNQKWGWSSLHASHLDRWVENKVDSQTMKENLDLLYGRVKKIEFPNLNPVGNLAGSLKKLKVKALVGGNLVTLTSHQGTPFEIQLKDRFLFFEEIGERAYRIDRCLTQLYLAGKFKGCKGILIGQMTQCLEPDGTDLLPWLWQHWADKLEIPVFTGVETGHDAVQRPLPLGTEAEIVNKNGIFSLVVKSFK